MAKGPTLFRKTKGYACLNVAMLTFRIILVYGVEYGELG
jgi:hypothetical protein